MNVEDEARRLLKEKKLKKIKKLTNFWFVSTLTFMYSSLIPMALAATFDLFEIELAQKICCGLIVLGSICSLVLFKYIQKRNDIKKKYE